MVSKLLHKRKRVVYTSVVIALENDVWATPMISGISY